MHATINVQGHPGATGYRYRPHSGGHRGQNPTGGGACATVRARHVRRTAGLGRPVSSRRRAMSRGWRRLPGPVSLAHGRSKEATTERGPPRPFLAIHSTFGVRWRDALCRVRCRSVCGRWHPGGLQTPVRCPETGPITKRTEFVISSSKRDTYDENPPGSARSAGRDVRERPFRAIHSSFGVRWRDALCRVRCRLHTGEAKNIMTGLPGRGANPLDALSGVRQRGAGTRAAQR